MMGKRMTVPRILLVLVLLLLLLLLPLLLGVGCMAGPAADPALGGT
jgi:hypothetical protein